MLHSFCCWSLVVGSCWLVVCWSFRHTLLACFVKTEKLFVAVARLCVVCCEQASLNVVPLVVVVRKKIGLCSLCDGGSVLFVAIRMGDLTKPSVVCEVSLRLQKITLAFRRFLSIHSFYSCTEFLRQQCSSSAVSRGVDNVSLLSAMHIPLMLNSYHWQWDVQSRTKIISIVGAKRKQMSKSNEWFSPSRKTTNFQVIVMWFIAMRWDGYKWFCCLCVDRSGIHAVSL